MSPSQPVNLFVNTNSQVPVYEQVCLQLSSLIRNGVLKPGDKLPGIRTLAEDLGVSQKPIRTAYAELIADLVLESIPKVGVFVAGGYIPSGDTSYRSKNDYIAAIKDLQPRQWVKPELALESLGLAPDKSPSAIISLSQNSPDPLLFPLVNIKQAASTVAWNPPPSLFDRGHPQGHQPLVEYLERYMDLHGVPMAETENDIIITDGFISSLDLVLQVIDARNRCIAVETPTYSSLVTYLRATKLRFTTIPMEQDGLNLEVLENKLASEDVCALVTIPTYHNPTSYCQSDEKRVQLIRLASQYSFVIIEDDWGRMLRYEGPQYQPLKALDPGGHVVCLGSFSKCFLPGMKAGWITAPPHLARSFLRHKFATRGASNHFVEAVLYEFIEKGNLDRHIRRSLKVYQRRRDRMYEVLSNRLQSKAKFTNPQGGFSIWVEFDKTTDCDELHDRAREQGVDILPGSYCTPDSDECNTVRLSFSRETEDRIEEGVNRLCDVLTCSPKTGSDEKM